MTSTAPSPPPAPAPASTRPRTPKKLAARAAIVVIVLGSALLWIYALSGAARQDPPNTLDDAAFPVAAEPRCEAARDALAELPRAEESRSATDRAEVLEQSNEILGSMLDDLRASAPSAGGASERDVSMVDEWLADWDAYIGDRADFAQRLRADEGARFYVTEKVKGLQVTKAIDDLAEVNDMPSCATPGDLG